MALLTTEQPLDVGGPLRRRMTAIANAHWFRKLAWRALRDGVPQAELRAANARTAARILLRRARREALIEGIAKQAHAALK